jgi:hypothetical protein
MLTPWSGQRSTQNGWPLLPEMARTRLQN